MAGNFIARVLLVEDEDFTLSLLRDALATASYEVEAYGSVS